MKECPDCKKPFFEHKKFCDECGIPLKEIPKRTCENCNADATALAKYCSECGFKFL